MNEENQVRLARKGNKEAFIQLIKHYEVSLYRISKSYLKADADCADAIQETILKAYQAIKSLQEPKYFYTWLIRILINQCNHMLSIKQKIIPVERFIERPQQTSSYDQIEIQEMIDTLEEELRIVITLYYLEDLPVKDIALILDIPEGTVKSRLTRARTKLAQQFTDKNERSVYRDQK